MGDKVPVALLGARLQNGHSEQHEMIELKPTKLRGVPSEGMVCSALELGLGEDHAGIMILPRRRAGRHAAGRLPGRHHLRAGDQGPLGLPFDAGRGAGGGCPAARSGDQLAWPTGEPPLDYAESRATTSTSSITIEIADPDLCPRYSATLVRGVEIGPSPRWLQERLIAAGLRPINNIVDVTNYVMWETGQPLHAFDYDLMHGKKIIVRRARPGETIVSLDGQKRELTADMCMIADADRAVAIGGVMGGLDSEVTEQTTNILLESANFLPTSIRRTAAACRCSARRNGASRRGCLPRAPIPGRPPRHAPDAGAGRRSRGRGVADCYPGQQGAAADHPDHQRGEAHAGRELSLAEIDARPERARLRRGTRRRATALRVTAPRCAVST